MTLWSVLLSILWLVIIPLAVGASFGFGRKIWEKAVWSWLFGQLFLWSVFQAIAVYEVKKGNSFIGIKKMFLAVVIASLAVSAVIVIIRFFISRKKGNSYAASEGALAGANESSANMSPVQYFKSLEKVQKIMLIATVVIIVAEMVLLAVLSYVDGDDSYFVAETTMTAASDRMYFASPYTGRESGLDIRHSFAPFPTWLAFISVITGTAPAAMAHVVFPMIHLPLTYIIYAMFGKKILGEKSRDLPVYMFFTVLLVLFGFYSYMTPEKFLMTRIRQGKATLASLIIPAVLICLFMILENLRDGKKTDLRIYLLLLFLNAAGCLCSSLGAVLCAIPPVLCAVFSAIAYKKFRHVIPLAFGCAPCVLMAVFLRFFA